MRNKGLTNKQKIIAIGLMLLVVLLIFLGLRAIIAGPQVNLDEHDRVAVKHRTIVTVSEDANTKLNSESLKELNSIIKAVNLTGVTAFNDERLNISAEPVNPEILSLENSVEIIEQLADADVDSRYDELYVGVMQRLLTENIQLMNDFNPSSTELRDAVEQSIADNQQLLQRLQE